MRVADEPIPVTRGVWSPAAARRKRLASLVGGKSNDLIRACLHEDKLPRAKVAMKAAAQASFSVFDRTRFEKYAPETRRGLVDPSALSVAIAFEGLAETP